MSAQHPFTFLGPRATVDAALRGLDSSRAKARALVDGLFGLARQDAALSLRLAMVLAYRCQNPECGRASLRNEAHHIHPRSLGGSDDLDNGVTVCRPCHLRGLHANEGGIRVDRVVVAGVPGLLWRYAGGRSVLSLAAR